MTTRETGKKEHTRRGVDANERDGGEVERDGSARGWAGADASDWNATEPTPGCSLRCGVSVEMRFRMDDFM